MDSMGCLVFGPPRSGDPSPEEIRAASARLIAQFEEAKMDGATLRLKMTVESVKGVCNGEGEKYQEEIALRAVYSDKEGSANKQWAKWTPAASLTMSVNNPRAFGKVLPGQFFFVDLIPTDKDAL